ILSLNTRGGKNRRVRHALMKRLLALNADIICLQDIKSLVSSSCNQGCPFCLPKSFHNFFTGSGINRGVLTLITKKMKIVSCVKEYSSRSDWHKIRISSNGVEFYIINAYGPNEKSFPFFQSIINNTQRCGLLPIILLGDLNVDLDNTSHSSPNRAALQKVILSLRLVDVMKKLCPGTFSWSRGNQKSRLDLALVSPFFTNRIRKAFYRPEPSSDHKLIELEMMCHHRNFNCKIPNWVLDDNKFRDKLSRNLEATIIKCHTAYQAV
ncbi:Uncharacterized protein FKW44_012221, partial [Caligus rogercresseyi]